MDRCRTKHILIDNVHPQRRCAVCTEEVVATVDRGIEENPNESIRTTAETVSIRFMKDFAETF